MVDLDDITRRFLRTCPPCDCGIPGECACPSDDPRPAIHALVTEVERLRGELAGALRSAGEEPTEEYLAGLDEHYAQMDED